MAIIDSSVFASPPLPSSPFDKSGDMAVTQRAAESFQGQANRATEQIQRKGQLEASMQNDATQNDLNRQQQELERQNQVAMQQTQNKAQMQMQAARIQHEKELQASSQAFQAQQQKERNILAAALADIQNRSAEDGFKPWATIIQSQVAKVQAESQFTNAVAMLTHDLQGTENDRTMNFLKDSLSQIGGNSATQSVAAQAAGSPPAKAPQKQMSEQQLSALKQIPGWVDQAASSSNAIDYSKKVPVEVATTGALDLSAPSCITGLCNKIASQGTPEAQVASQVLAQTAKTYSTMPSKDTALMPPSVSGSAVKYLGKVQDHLEQLRDAGQLSPEQRDRANVTIDTIHDIQKNWAATTGLEQSMGTAIKPILDANPNFIDQLTSPQGREQALQTLITQKRSSFERLNSLLEMSKNASVANNRYQQEIRKLRSRAAREAASGNYAESDRLMEQADKKQQEANTEIQAIVR